MACHFAAAVVMATCLLLLSPGNAADDWLKEPYGDDSFNIRAEFNSNVTLSCNQSLPVGNEPRYWIRPDTKIMYAGESEEFRTLDGMASWRVSDNAYEMIITLVQPEHFGFYYCVTNDNTSSNSEYVVKLAVNYEGPYWGDLWKKYETPTIVALSASGGFLVLAILLAITWHFRWQVR